MKDADLPDADKARILQTIMDDLHKAQVVYSKRLKELYPLHSYVRWYDRPYFRSGLVEGYGQMGTTLVVRESALDRFMTVHPREVIRAVEETTNAG